MAWCQQQGVAEVRNRFLEAPRRMKREPQIRHRVRRSGIDLQRLRQEAQCLRHAAALQVEKAKQMQRVEIVAPVLQNPGTQPFGLVELTFSKRAVGLPLQARQVRRPRGGIFPMSRQLASLGGAGERIAHESIVAREASMFGIIRLNGAEDALFVRAFGP